MQFLTIVAVVAVSENIASRGDDLLLDDLTRHLGSWCPVDERAGSVVVDVRFASVNGGAPSPELAALAGYEEIAPTERPAGKSLCELADERDAEVRAWRTDR